MYIDGKSIDWKLLRDQKEWLIERTPADEYDNIVGLLYFIDYIQDEAVVQGIASTEEVFGITLED